jgi:RHS repeat-associated protein
MGDHLGSTSLVVNTSGAQAARRSYLPFGAQWAASGSLPTDFGFTGQREADEIGLYYYVARWLDPEIAHFVQADTIVPGAGNPAAWNRYGYVMYNPVKYTDPSGHSPACDGGSDQPGWCPVNIKSRESWGAYEPGSVISTSDDLEGLYDPVLNTHGYMEYEGSLEAIYHTIVIHHSFPADSSWSPLEIQYAEMSDGSYDIAYHFIIGPDGVIYEGRDIGARGAHTAIGRDPVLDTPIGNTGRIGVLLIGDFTDEEPTRAHDEALFLLLGYLDHAYGIDYLYGHRDLNSTECPGDNAYYLVEKYQELIK